MTHFVVQVPQVGTFECRRLTLGTQLDILAAVDQLSAGQPLDGMADWRASLLGLVAELRVLVAKAPAGWSLDLDSPEVDFGQLRAVREAIRDKENSFRAVAAGIEGPSEEPGEVAPVVVSKKVRPAAE